MSTKMPWFRMYTDFLNDPKMISLAFEDQRHFIGVLALKSDGAIDDTADENLLNRIVAQRLWIDHGVIREVKKRLKDAGLIDSEWQPVAWDKRQFVSDRSAPRVAKHRELQKEKQKTQGNDDVTLQQQKSNALDTDTDKDTDKEEDKYKKTRASAPPDGVSDSVWADFKAVRKAKRMALTDTAIKLIRNQAENAGYTLQQALEICCERGWGSFNHEWLDKAKPGAATETTYQRSKRLQMERDFPNLTNQFKQGVNHVAAIELG